MKAMRSDGLGGQGVTFTPQSGSYSNVVVWMHGLGDRADGWASQMNQLGIENTKFVLPTATNRRITLNRGMSMPAWSDIFGLDEDSAEDKTGFEESAARVNAIVQAELDKGIDAKKIVIAGFSQGGALALHVALRSQHSLGGCVALSTWLPFRNEYPAALSSAAAKLPIFQIHGDEDMVVNAHWGQGSHALMKKIIPDPAPQFMLIEGMGHHSDPQEFVAITKFLKNVFSQ